MPELVTLPLYCAACGQPAAVEIERDGIRPERARLHVWECPDCFRPNSFSLDGQIIAVSRGHDHPDLPRKVPLGGTDEL